MTEDPKGRGEVLTTEHVHDTHVGLIVTPITGWIVDYRFA